MTTLVQQPPLKETRPAPAPPPEQRFLLSDVDWQSYVLIGRALADRPGLRITYDRGSLELMTTSPKHEIYKQHLNRFVEIMAEELNRPFTTAGNMTFQKQQLERGMEPDDCFWLEHEPAMRGKLTWDPDVDPPPDLGLEIEISRSALGRMQIYAALRVPEVWCFDGRSLRVYRLHADGTYQHVTTSQVFPEVPVVDLLPFIVAIETTDILTNIRAFRGWLRGLIDKRSQPT
jgi:Uma2 family endonuclease